MFTLDRWKRSSGISSQNIFQTEAMFFSLIISTVCICRREFIHYKLTHQDFSLPSFWPHYRHPIPIDHTPTKSMIKPAINLVLPRQGLSHGGKGMGFFQRFPEAGTARLVEVVEHLKKRVKNNNDTAAINRPALRNWRFTTCPNPGRTKAESNGARIISFMVFLIRILLFFYCTILKCLSNWRGSSPKTTKFEIGNKDFVHRKLCKFNYFVQLPSHS